MLQSLSAFSAGSYDSLDGGVAAKVLGLQRLRRQALAQASALLAQELPYDFDVTQEEAKRHRILVGGFF